MPHQTLLACDQEEDTDHEKHTDSKLLRYVCMTAFLKYQHGAADMSDAVVTYARQFVASAWFYLSSRRLPDE